MFLRCYLLGLGIGALLLTFMLALVANFLGLGFIKKVVGICL